MLERELILGGQKSGKSRRAEQRAADWLAAAPAHRAVLIATAQAHDDEMHQRIAHHQRDRAARVPGLRTVEEPRALAQALAAHSAPDTLVVIDCLTLWLTNQLMPLHDGGTPSGAMPANRSPAAPAGQPACADAPLPGGRLGVGPQEFTSNRALTPVPPAQAALFLIALQAARGPVVIVGNEIGLGVIPLGREVRAFVDALGLLNQQVAAACERVTLMAAGLPLTLKEPA